jgi:glycosyltransferase involved in cell wall biosynthesis
MLAEPLVSIIIPVYNGEEHIDACIQSVLNQTWQNKEIIIIDDGSTDKSYEVVKRYECSFLIILKQKNKGASAARNYGLKHSKGEYIQFLDADDLLSENKIEGQVLQLINKPECLGLCASIHFEDGTEPELSNLYHSWYSTGSNDPIDFITKLYHSNDIGTGYGGMIQPNAWLTPRILINRVGDWNENISVDDDGDFFCRLILNSKGIVYNYDSINYYRKHKSFNNLSSNKSEKAFLSKLEALNSKHNYLSIKANNNNLADKVFASDYWEIGVQSYPQFPDISKHCISRAKLLGYVGPKYNAGKKSTILSKVIGWKLTRFFSYYIYKI